MRSLISGLGYTKTYSDGQVIYREGEPAEAVFALEEGMIKLVGNSVEGKEFVLHLIKPWRLFGHADVVRGGAYSCTGVAMKEGKVRIIPANEWKSVVMAHPEILWETCVDIATNLHVMTSRMKGVVLGTTKQRLAQYLIMQEKKAMAEDGKIRLIFSRETLASILNMSRENVSRDLAKLVEDGAISVEGKNIGILSKSRLKEIGGK